MNGNHHSVQLLLEELKGLLPAQFEELLLVLKVPVEYLPSREAAQTTRAVDLIRWAEKAEVLERLEVELNRFRPQPPPVADIPPEPKVVPLAPPPVTSVPPEPKIVLPAPQQKTFVNSIGMEFVLVPAGEFLMGGDKYDFEKPIHKVTIGNPFYLGKYQVTQKEWKAVMGENPSWYWFIGDERVPVHGVNWQDCQKFIERLNKVEKEVLYRLPSEAEWEYSCRAGTMDDYAGKLEDLAWYSKSILGTFKNLFNGMYSVGLKKANNFGLYDMHGNVWEWCQDRWHNNYFGAPMDGSAWETGDGERRVLRGGSWENSAIDCRSASRYNFPPTIRYFGHGLRLAMTHIRK
jgi:formylglycine-generating enzyme required for sulfatase activity